MKEAEVIAVSTDSFQRSRKPRQLWFPKPHNHPYNCLACWGKWHALFKSTDSCTAAVENFSLHSAQVVVMKLNTHNNFLKQLHCVIVTKWLQGLQRIRMKKTCSNASSITFYTKAPSGRTQFIFIYIFYLFYPKLDGCQNTTFLVDLQLLGNFKTPYDYMLQGWQLTCQMAIWHLSPSST